MPLAVSASLIWKPIVHNGLRFDIGSCGTRPIEEPRSARMAFRSAWAMSCPRTGWLAPVTFPLPGSRSMIACAMVDLPEPDSPTTATVWPG